MCAVQTQGHKKPGVLVLALGPSWRGTCLCPQPSSRSSPCRRSTLILRKFLFTLTWNVLPWVDLVILSGATQNMPACFIMIWLFSALHWGFRCEGFSPGQWPRALPMGPGWHCSSGLLRVGAHWELKSVSPLKAEDASCVLLPQSLLPPCLCLPAWPSVLLSLLEGTPQATLVSCWFLLCP